MGPGRRQKRKQGPPEPLSEEHFAKLKRKAGLPLEKPAAVSPAKKRRTAEQPAKSSFNGSTKLVVPTSKGNGQSGKKNVALPDPEDVDSEQDEELDDEFDDADLDGAAGSSLDEDEGVALGDDFLDSDDSVFDSDGDQQQQKGDFAFSEDEDESDAEEKLTAANIEGLTHKLDKQLQQEAEEADAELQADALQTNIEGDAGNILDNQEDENDANLAARTKALLAPDLQLLRTRITDTVRILEDFSKLAEEGRTRSEYKAQLLRDICAYYGYSEYLADLLLNLFPPKEAFAFFEANETPRPVVIRTNTLRTSRRSLAQALINRGVVLEPIGKWSKVGLQIFESGVPIGATPEYLAGHYILQAASSFLPVMALCPGENERVLDMAAAPGGKTTYMAALMKNTGCIFANDPNKNRARGLIANIHRLGCRNVIVSNYDAREFPKVMGGFDRVLLDAPCSGTGVISKDPSIKTNKTEKDFMVLPHTQKQLLLAAIDSVNHASKTGGYLVYSTCSITVAENEEVVQYALKKRPNVKLVDTGLPFGKEGFVNYMGKHFDASMGLTRRYYPHAVRLHMDLHRCSL
jgi:25S rRNA (cytosine2870-C5)-methyltransferase